MIDPNIHFHIYSEQHIPHFRCLMSVITPTDIMVYISITFLLTVFASQCNSLIQYFFKTNNIFR
jgi:hypothetical protein